MDDVLVDTAKVGYSGFIPVTSVRLNDFSSHRASLFFHGSSVYYADPNGPGEQEPQELIMLEAIAAVLGRSWGGVLNVWTNKRGLLDDGNCVPTIVIESVVTAMGPRSGLRFLRDVALDHLSLALSRVYKGSNIKTLFEPLGVVRELVSNVSSAPRWHRPVFLAATCMDRDDRGLSAGRVVALATYTACNVALYGLLKQHHMATCAASWWSLFLTEPSVYCQFVNRALGILQWAPFIAVGLGVGPIAHVRLV